MHVIRHAHLLRIAVLCFVFASDTATGEVERPDDWKRLLDNIRLIQDDRGAAALAVVDWPDWGCDALGLLHAPPARSETVAAAALDDLEFVVLNDSDDWLADRISLSLALCSDADWSPTFLELLRHPSPQRRWRAIGHFAAVRSPDSLSLLEELWREELPSWVRADLVEALRLNGSVVHVENCIGLIESGDADLARAGVVTLGSTRPEGALRPLRRHATNAESSIRLEAVSALAAWPDDEESMRLLIELTRSQWEQLRDHSIRALSHFEQRRATERLIQIAADPAVGALARLDALNAVIVSDHPDLLPALRAILDQPPSPGSAPLVRAARAALADRGVDPPQPDDNELETFESMTLAIGWSVGVDGEIGKPTEGSSVRCWQAPHVEGEPGEFGRLLSGSAVGISDHFVSRGEHWIQLTSGNCWIPFEQIVEPTEQPNRDEQWPLRQEFDVRLEEVDSAMGKTLLETGMIRLFDIGETVTAVRFEIDPGDREAVTRLVEIYAKDDSGISWYLEDAIDELESIYRKDPELAERISAALDVAEQAEREE